ncbi:Vps36-domain-containing protein [Saitoella complicata NRRL Y-17804]|nr:Vps36-domain-containing protein [Saitoella complicata NRRL Y-17804]ODQ51644.1 Vps36-domain-containing protein [Saitoella complicata NRRL Y-17804]
MHRWSKINLTSARRPELSEDETTLFVQIHVGLYDGKYKSADHQNGAIYLTSKRVCYVDSAQSGQNSVGLELALIDSYDTYAGFMRSSPKITLHLHDKASATASNVNSGIVTPDSSNVTAQPTTLPLTQWICPICSFSNPLPSQYTSSASAPPCLTCGIKPAPEVLAKAAAQRPAPVSLPNPAEVFSSSDDDHTFACPVCTFHNHPSLTSCEMCGSPLMSSNLPPALRNTAGAESPGPMSSGIVRARYVKISFRQGGERQFLERLRGALRERRWEAAPPIGDLQITPIPEQRGFGIGGLQRADESVRKTNEVAMGNALEDLDALMKRAKEMVALAEAFAHRLASAPSTTGNTEARAALLESTQALGLSSPVVTREITGGNDVYHAELAKQVAEFLESGILQKEGGTVTLIDLFALYNRARGVALVSPADLAKACTLFAQLKLPVRLRTFKSGLVVVHDASRKDETVIRRLKEWISSYETGATCQETAEQFKWSVGVALEELELAEASGTLCRDESIEGVKFWINEFITFTWDVDSVRGAWEAVNS